MGLIIQPKNDKTIVVPGVDLTLNSLYVRVEFAGRADGKTLEVAPSSYMNKAKYEVKEPCITNIPMQNFSVELQEGETQSIETSLAYSKQVYESLGYDVTIEE